MKVIILGPAGRMGRAITQLAHREPRLEIAGAVGPASREYIGRDIGFVCDLGSESRIFVSDDLEKIITDCELVLDCSRPDVSMEALRVCRKYNKAFVTGTTGFTEIELQELRAAGKDIPVLLAGNTSRMVQVLYDLVREVTKRFGHESDIDVIDVFDRDKMDAPSGTSREIAGIIAGELELDDSDYTYGRKGLGTRKAKSLAFTSLRTGDHPGTIKVIFGQEHEKIELSVQVYRMNAYAQGMIDAALFLVGKTNGFYQTEDVVSEVISEVI